MGRLEPSRGRGSTIGRGGALLLAFLVATLGSSALALTVSAPTAAVLPRDTPLVVQWNGAPGPGVIDIRLVRLTPTTYVFADLAIGVANTGQATVSLPEDASCDPAHTYKLALMRRAVAANPTVWIDRGDSAPFRLSCDRGPRPDRITVINRIVNNTTFPTPVTTFDVVVSCRPSGVQTTFRLLAPRNLQRITVPAGSRCSITGSPSPAPRRPCAWITTYPLGREALPGEALTMVNELRCDGEVGDGLHDRLTVIKRIVNDTGVPITGIDFQVRIDCAPMGPHTTVTLSPPGNLQRTIPVPAGSRCAIFEAPPRAPPRCRWNTTYPTGTLALPGSAPTVVNELRCDGAGDATPSPDAD